MQPRQPTSQGTAGYEWEVGGRGVSHRRARPQWQVEGECGGELVEWEEGLGDWEAGALGGQRGHPRKGRVMGE